MNSNERILILDDSNFAISQMTSILKDLGYHNFETFTSGEKALERIFEAVTTNKPFQTVFLDLIMPGITGMEFIDRIQELIQMHGLKIILVTSETQPDLILDLLNKGARAYVKKPYNTKAIEDTLNKVFSRSKVG